MAAVTSWYIVLLLATGAPGRGGTLTTSSSLFKLEITQISQNGNKIGKWRHDIRLEVPNHADITVTRPVISSPDVCDLSSVPEDIIATWALDVAIDTLEVLEVLAAIMKRDKRLLINRLAGGADSKEIARFPCPYTPSSHEARTFRKFEDLVQNLFQNLSWEAIDEYTTCQKENISPNPDTIKLGCMRPSQYV